MAENISQEDQEILDEIVNDEFEDQPADQPQTTTESKSELNEQPEAEERVVTEEDIEKLSLPQGYLGKPYAETLETLYVNIKRFEDKNSKNIADLQKQLKAFEEQLSKKEVKQAEEAVEEKLPDYEAEIQEIYDKFIDDDGYTDKKGLSIALAKFNKEYQDKHDRLLKNEFKKMLDESTKPFSERLESTSKTAQDIQEKENQVMLVDSLSELLGGIYDKVDQNLIQSTFKEYESYIRELASDMGEEEYQNYFNIYKGNPKLLAKEVFRNHKANLHGKVKRSADEIHNKQVEKIKKQSKTFINSATSARDKHEDVDPEYDDILNEAGEDAENWMRQINE